MSEVAVTIDWLRYTVHYHSKGLPSSAKHWSADRLAFHVTHVAGAWKDVKAHNNYSASVESKQVPNLTVSWNVKRPDMGVSVDWPGSALRDQDKMEVLRDAIDLDAKVSRIDLAVDYYDQMDGNELKERWWKDEVVTRAKFFDHRDTATGWTFYVGARTSEKYLRVYDKAAQMEVNGDWTRIELECKGEFARQIANYLSVQEWSGIPAVITSFCDWPTYEPWVEAMTCPTPFIGVPKIERHSNTRAWLLEQCAPALVKFCRDNPDFYAAWNERLITLTLPESGVGESDIFDGNGDFDL